MKILLHICCGVCATSVIERLRSESNEVSGLFYNPNIYPMEEYEKRLKATKKIAKKMKLVLFEGQYVPQEWFNLTKNYSEFPEGGLRCNICYEMRLKYTYDFCKSNNFDKFTTTLTVSPHKKSDIINEIGKKIGDKLFLETDFKKNNGFNRAIKIAKNWDLYRQNYCGCKYSMRS